MKHKKSLLVVIALILSIGILLAQEAEASSAAPANKIGFLQGAIDIVVDSGTTGIVIILVVIIGLAYAVVRYIQLYVREKIDPETFFVKLKNYIKNNQIDEAITVARDFQTTTMGFIFYSGLNTYKDVVKSGKQGEEARVAVQNAFDEAVLQTVHKLDGNLFWFDTLAQISTYLGLLGTIFGLIEAFNSLAGLTGAEQNAALTQGIKKAIGTTALGLIGAIPLTLIKGGLFSRAQVLISSIDEYSVKVVNYINNLIKG
ncbi:MAG: MotA/TolQ/ExbB proton channel family protein [Candidatus Cloacimonetes bacterium]|nr:MotA/TolQ/ExbB proton channel family protein [Candidatus Cloacimonadota bacterium]